MRPSAGLRDSPSVHGHGQVAVVAVNGRQMFEGQDRHALSGSMLWQGLPAVNGHEAFSWPLPQPFRLWPRPGCHQSLPVRCRERPCPAVLSPGGLLDRRYEASCCGRDEDFHGQEPGLIRGHGRDGRPRVTRYEPKQAAIPPNTRRNRGLSRRSRRAATEVSSLATDGSPPAAATEPWWPEGPPAATTVSPVAAAPGLPPTLPRRAAPAVEMSSPVARRPSPVGDGEGGLPPGAAGGLPLARRRSRRGRGPSARRPRPEPPRRDCHTTNSRRSRSQQ